MATCGRSRSRLLAETCSALSFHRWIVCHTIVCSVASPAPVALSARSVANGLLTCMCPCGCYRGMTRSGAGKHRILCRLCAQGCVDIPHTGGHVSVFPPPTGTRRYSSGSLIASSVCLVHVCSLFNDTYSPSPGVWLKLPLCPDPLWTKARSDGALL